MTSMPLRFSLSEGCDCRVRLEGPACQVREIPYDAPFQFLGHDKHAPPNGHDKRAPPTPRAYLSGLSSLAGPAEDEIPAGRHVFF
jgi:hypothetical protein